MSNSDFDRHVQELNARQVREQRRRDEENAAVRERRQAREDQARQEERERHAAEVEQSLAAEKASDQRSWLAAHPGKTAEDFDREAWPHLRENHLEQRRQREQETLKGEMRRLHHGVL